MTYGLFILPYYPDTTLEKACAPGKPSQVYSAEPAEPSTVKPLRATTASRTLWATPSNHLMQK